MFEDEKDQGAQDLAGDGLGDAPSGAQGEDLERARAEIADLNNRLLRAQADFENYRRRVAREREELAVYANQKLVVSLLPVLDNLDRALATPTITGDEKLRQGVEMTARSFRDILAKEGVTTIEAVGQPFDPNLHEAVMTAESDEHEDGVVLMEFQKGYRLGDRTVRPSMVQVSKKA